jgi:mannose-6-phosphate isomerase-like protein (cupin superfamily)
LSGLLIKGQKVFSVFSPDASVGIPAYRQAGRLKYRNYLLLIINYYFMQGYIVQIDEATKANENFRKVLYTAKHSQLVVMSLLPNEDIGEEIHETVDQFIRIEQGTGKAVLDGVEHDIESEYAVVIPAGTKHNIINTSHDEPMKLYTIYSPPEHQDGVMRATKAEAMAQEEHFDGGTTE